MDYAKAIIVARKPVDIVLGEIAKVWKSLGLTADETAERVLEIEARLDAAASAALAAEQELVATARGHLAELRLEAAALARKVGEELQVTASGSLANQKDELAKERKRLEECRDRQLQEVRDLEDRITKEAERMGLDPADYSLPPDSTGSAAVRAANQRFRQLENLREERIVEVQRTQARVRSLTKELGEPLEFRVAMDGELTGSDDGVVVLANTEENLRFVRELADFEGTSKRELLSSIRFKKHVTRLEEEYTREAGKKKESCVSIPSRSKPHVSKGRASHAGVASDKSCDWSAQSASSAEGSPAKQQRSAPSKETRSRGGGGRSRDQRSTVRRATDDAANHRHRHARARVHSERSLTRRRHRERDAGRRPENGVVEAKHEGGTPRKAHSSKQQPRKQSSSKRSSTKQPQSKLSSSKQPSHSAPDTEARAATKVAAVAAATTAAAAAAAAANSSRSRRSPSQSRWSPRRTSSPERVVRMRSHSRQLRAWSDEDGENDEDEPPPLKRPRRVQLPPQSQSRSCSLDRPDRPSSSPPRTTPQLPPSPAPSNKKELEAEEEDNEEVELVEEQDVSKKDVQEKVGTAKALVEMLYAMQGPWVDRSGVMYKVTERRVERDDGRSFHLQLGNGVISWGPAGKYFAAPTENVRKEVRWINSRTRQTAWVWSRPPKITPSLVPARKTHARRQERQEHRARETADRAISVSD